MDELYVESFFSSKKASSPKPLPIEESLQDLSLALPSKLLKTEQQIHSSFWLLKQEVNKRFERSFPIQKLLKQIEEGIVSSNQAEVIPLLEQLEELIDAKALRE